MVEIWTRVLPFAPPALYRWSTPHQRDKQRTHNVLNITNYWSRLSVMLVRWYKHTDLDSIITSGDAVWEGGNEIEASVACMAASIADPPVEGAAFWVLQNEVQRKAPSHKWNVKSIRMLQCGWVASALGLKCKWTEKRGLTIYPWSHFLEDLAENLLPQMPDKVWHNIMVGGA